MTIAVIADDTISIHAPTQGATGGADTNVCRFADFNPRSHARSDKATRVKGGIVLNFNPRSHARSDYIHEYYDYPWDDFNPRSHARSDMAISAISTDKASFQSTLPRKERLICLPHHSLSVHFNPRSHARSDRECGVWG